MAKHLYAIELLAPAKVNLTLEILGKRPDGYHGLRSVLMPVSLFDTVRLEVLPGNGVECEMRAEGVDVSGMSGENLAARAARLFQERTGIFHGVRIRIVKRIPLGGGLGGGSADAAAVLRGLQTLWGARLKRAELISMAAELGSDVPAMALGGAVLMTGRGEHVRRIRVPPGRGMWMVIANDGTHCPTGEIYKRYARAKTQGAIRETRNFSRGILVPVRSGDVEKTAQGLKNDLQEVVFENYPGVAALAERLKVEGGRGVLLSGSGASVFTLVQSKIQGETMRKNMSNCVKWVTLVQTLPENPTGKFGRVFSLA